MRRTASEGRSLPGRSIISRSCQRCRYPAQYRLRSFPVEHHPLSITLREPEIRCQSRNYSPSSLFHGCGRRRLHRDPRVRRTLHELAPSGRSGSATDRDLFSRTDAAPFDRIVFRCGMADSCARSSNLDQCVVELHRPLDETGVRTDAASSCGEHRVCDRSPRIQTGSRTGERHSGESPPITSTGHCSDVSGYIAADELYDGPFSVLSTVDTPTPSSGPVLPSVSDRDPIPWSTSRRWPSLLQALPPREHDRPADHDLYASTLYPEPISSSLRMRCRSRSANSTSFT